MDRDKLREEAARLLTRHQLLRWKFEIREHTGHRLGGCHYKTFTVIMNGFYVDNNGGEVVLDTLLHEVAHALTPGHKHDHVWRAMAVRLGCRPETEWKKGIVVQPGKWQATCPTCKALFNKYRKPKYVQGYYCPKCGKEHGRLNFQTTGAEHHEG